MAAWRSFQRHDLPEGLGPFSYGFRPSPAGRFGTILIRAPEGAPTPARGDLFVLTTDDCYDADFEVMEVVREADGWRVGCERAPVARTPEDN